MHRRWLVNKTNPAFIQHLSTTASVSPLLAQILINRGIKTAGDIRSYLNHGLADLSDPFAIQGMKEAVVRIMEAARAEKRSSFTATMTRTALLQQPCSSRR